MSCRIPLMLICSAVIVLIPFPSKAEGAFDMALKCTGFFVIEGYNKLDKEWVVTFFADGRADFDSNAVEYEMSETSVILKSPFGCSATIVREEDKSKICYSHGTVDRVSGKVDFTISSLSAMSCDSSNCTAWAVKYYSGKCTVAQRLF